MASLAAYFGLGKQSHRSLDDVRLNLEVVKHCATVLFLESANPWEQIPIPVEYGNPGPNSIPSNEAMMVVEESSSTTTPSDAFTQQTEFLPSNELYMASITVSVSPPFHGSHKIQILHRDIPLQIRCDSMKIRFGLSTEFVDHAGRPRLSFVVDANSSNLCNLLDACDNIARRFVDSDSNSEWRPVVTRNPGFYDSPTIRLHLRTVVNGDANGWMTEIYHKDSSSSQLVSISSYDVALLGGLFRTGSFVDAYLCLDPYNYQQNAGIRLVAKKLVLHC